MENLRKPPYKYCLVPECKNTIRSAPDKVFFQVPVGAKNRKRWCNIIRRSEVSPSTTLHCCEDHFNIEEDTENYVRYNIMKQEGVKVTLRLKKGVLPHIFHCQNRNITPTIVRMGAIKRERLALLEEALSVLPAKQSDVVETFEPPQQTSDEAGCSSSNIEDSILLKKDEKLCNDKAVQSNIKIKHRSKSVHVTIKKKNIALSPLKCHVKNTATSPLKSKSTLIPETKLLADNPDGMSMSSLSTVKSLDYEPSCSSESSWMEDDESDNDKQFKSTMRSSILMAIEKEPKMLLGLPKKSYHLIQLLSENVPLSTIDILITLKKIKLNESFTILALQFGYSQSTVSRIFSKSVPLIAEKMKDLIVWPTPTEIYKRLPISFRSRYANVVSIIDCLEIQIEKPSDALHQSLTWSQYKKCNTLKYFISCTPDGLVNFISEGYGGRATDVAIVQDCGYLEFLPPNKAIMADRGFKDLSHLLEAKSTKLIRPPSVSKLSPSTKEEVKLSKRIAALRIHIERVINRLREFHMLLPHACIDHNLISIIDEVIIVGCGLINLQDVLIKK